MANILQDPVKTVMLIILAALTIPAIVFWIVVLIKTGKETKENENG